MSAQLGELDRQRAALVRLDDAVALQWTTVEALTRLQDMLGAHARWVVAPSNQLAESAHASHARLGEVFLLLEQMEVLAPDSVNAMSRSADQIATLAAEAALAESPDLSATLAALYALSEAPVTVLQRARADAEGSLMRGEGYGAQYCGYSIRQNRVPAA